MRFDVQNPGSAKKTAIIIFLSPFIGVLGGALYVVARTGGWRLLEMPFMYLGMSVFFIFVAWQMWPFAAKVPLSYELCNDSLIIRHFIGTTKIKYPDIAQIDRKQVGQRYVVVIKSQAKPISMLPKISETEYFFQELEKRIPLPQTNK